MPARKPSSLHTRHATKAEKAERIAAEESMTPENGLPKQAPARLAGHKAAAVAWRALMRAWETVEQPWATRLDMDVICDYCILMEQTAELDLMRRTTYTMWLEIGAKHDQVIKKALEASKAARAAQDAAAAGGEAPPEKGMGSLAEVDKWETQAVELASKALDAFEAVVKLDGRVDRKRALLLTFRQSLYLTPRARAGVTPGKKEAEEAPDPMDALLGEVTQFVNGQGKEDAQG